MPAAATAGAADLLAILRAGFAQRREMLAVVESQIVLGFTKAGSSSIQRHIWRITRVVNPNVDSVITSEYFDRRLPDCRVGLLTDLAGVVDDPTIAGIDSVVFGSWTLYENVVGSSHDLPPGLSFLPKTNRLLPSLILRADARAALGPAVLGKMIVGDDQCAAIEMNVGQVSNLPKVGRVGKRKGRNSTPSR